MALGKHARFSIAFMHQKNNIAACLLFFMMSFTVAYGQQDKVNPNGYNTFHYPTGTISSEGYMKDGKPEGYWEWYRIDGTIKRSGYFVDGDPMGEWITYDNKGEPYKVSKRT